jgi:hypothetical protein
MLTIIGYIILAVFIAFVFKFIVGLVELAVVFLLFLVSGFSKQHEGQDSGDRLAMLLDQHPKVFFTYRIFFLTTIGVLYALIIADVTFQFISGGGNVWVYSILSLIWGFSLLNQTEAFHGVLLSSCLLSLVLIHLGFGILAVLAVWLLTILVSLGYYYGRIDVLRQQMLAEKHLA